MHLLEILNHIQSSSAACRLPPRQVDLRASKSSYSTNISLEWQLLGKLPNLLLVHPNGITAVRIATQGNIRFVFL
jgi:hypothetical protein